MRPSRIECAIAVVLLAANVATGAALVLTTHAKRSLFQEHEALNREHDRLRDDWSALRLEVGTLSGHSRIDEIARDELGMVEPGDRLRFDVAAQ